jgi:hypothetical protein
MTDKIAVAVARSFDLNQQDDRTGAAKFSHAAAKPLHVMATSMSTKMAELESAGALPPLSGISEGMQRMALQPTISTEQARVGIRFPNASTASCENGIETSIAMFAAFSTHAMSLSDHP